MAITAHGKIHGCTIQLDSELGIPDGAEVEVTVVVTFPKPAWGEGLKRSAGAAADMPEFDEALAQIARERNRPQFGSCKGMLTIETEDEDHLRGFPE